MVENGTISSKISVHKIKKSVGWTDRILSNPHFRNLMVCTRMWHVHFLSKRTLELVPFPAAPCNLYIKGTREVTLKKFKVRI